MRLNDQEKIDLIRAYEPILYFHPDEKDVPVNPRAYIEASALWCVQPSGRESRHKKTNWGRCRNDSGFTRRPLIRKGELSVNASDDLEGGLNQEGVPKWFLGHQSSAGRRPYLASSSDGGPMLWLDMAGWHGSQGVTEHSRNVQMDLEYARRRWSTDPLSKERYWYYAEVEELDTLGNIITSLSNEGLTPDFFRQLLHERWLIWYYFLYPVHEVQLRRCEQVLGAGGADSPGGAIKHGNYEGDWNAVGIIVKSPLNFPWQDNPFPNPEYIGFGRRARGWLSNEVSILRPQMAVEAWDGGLVTKVGSHPRIFIAKGSHNAYPTTGEHTPPEPEAGRLVCGETEKADEWYQGVEDDVKEAIDTVNLILVSVLKIGGGCAIGALIFFPFGCVIGAAVGGIAALIEALADSDDQDVTESDGASQAEGEALDQAPPYHHYGLILAPVTLTDDNSRSALVEDGAEAAEILGWDGEVKDKLVREDQVWWPGEKEKPGYNGRWGVMVQDDPKDRRSGIEFPNFKRAFLIDLAIKQSQL